MDNISDLAGVLNQSYGAPIIFGTITGLGNLEDRSLVEVQLDAGETVNAVAYTQALLAVGQRVVLGHTQGSDSLIFSILAVNGPAIGLDPMTRDTSPTTMLWDKEPLRPEQVPLHEGDIYIFDKTLQSILLNVETYTKLRVDLAFTLPPNNSVVRYLLYGWSPLTIDPRDPLVPPDFVLPIGSTWKSADNRLHRTVFNIDAAGSMGDFLFEAQEANFCIAMERLTDAPVRGSNVGKIRSAAMIFMQDIECEPLTCVSRSDLRISTIDPNLVQAPLSAVCNLDILQWNLEVRSTLTVEGVVMG